MAAFGWAAFAAWFVLRSGLELTRPLAQDQGIFFWVWDTIRQGGLPYRDAWELKGPGLLYFVALIQEIFGGAIWAMRAADIVITAAGLLLVYKLASRLHPRGGWAAAVLYFAWYASLDFENTSQPDAWVGVALAGATLATLLLTYSTARLVNRQYFALGLLLGIAVTFKPVYALYAVVPLIAWWWGPTRHAWRPLVAAVAGGALPLLAVVAWFSAHGALSDLIEANLLYTSSAYAQGSSVERFGVFARLLVTNPSMCIALLIAACALVVLYRSGRKVETAMFVAWVLITASIIAIQAKYWPYHWVPFFVALSVPAGAGVSMIASRVQRAFVSAPRPAFTVVAAALAGLCGGPEIVRSATEISQWVNTRVDAAAAARFEARYGVFGDSPGAIHDVARTMAQLSSAEETVAFWGMKPAVYVLSGRRSATRFGFNWTLVRRPGNPYYIAWRAEYLADVKAKQPRVFVALNPANCRATASSDLECLDSHPELRDYVLRNYRVHSEVGIYRIFVRTASGSAL